MKFALEKYKFFPVIAWGLIIGFVLFTYSLTMHLAESNDSLSERTQKTVTALEESK